MTDCPNCGHHLVRMHRTAAQKLLYSDVFSCSNCHHRVSRLHHVFTVNLTFFLSRYTHCIRCGSARVERLAKRDPIESMSWRFTSQLFHLTGAPLKKCPTCRLQYYDWRPPEPDARQLYATQASNGDAMPRRQRIG